MRRVAVDWLEMSEALGVQYVHPPEEAIMAGARARADAWARRWEAESGRPLADCHRARLEREAHDMAICHWSAPKIILAHVDIDALVDASNQLCRETAGADGLAGWERLRADGLAFLVEEGILRPCAEADPAAAPARIPDVGPGCVLMLLRTAQDALLGGPPLVDLRRWDERQEELAADASKKLVLRAVRGCRQMAAAAG